MDGRSRRTRYKGAWAIALGLMCASALGCGACSHPDPATEADASATQPQSRVKPPPMATQSERVTPPPAQPKPQGLGALPSSGPPRQYGQLTVPASAVQAFAGLLTPPQGRPLRVVQYGDSHTRASTISDTLRDRFASGQLVSPGLVQPGHPMRWNASVKKRGTWNRHNWLYGRDKPSFGPMGLAYSVTNSQLARRDPSRMTLSLDRPHPDAGIRVTAYYLLENQHLPFKLTSRRAELARVTAPSGALPAPQLGQTTVELPPGASSLDLEVLPCASCSSDAELRFFGFQVEYPQAQVSWDALGIGGTTIYSPTVRSDGTMDAYLTQRDADLVVTWYGSNSSVDKNLDTSLYRERFDKLVARLRRLSPNAACLVVGPPDLNRRPDKSCMLNSDERRILKKRRRLSSKDRKRLRANRATRNCNPDALLGRDGRRYPVPEVRNARQWEQYKRSCQYRTVPLIPQLTEIQRDIAAKHGCAFFDVYQYMGGPQSILKWACGDPQRASHDLVHLTRDGYSEVGRAIHDAVAGMTRAATLEANGAAPTPYTQPPSAPPSHVQPTGATPAPAPRPTLTPIPVHTP